jgi:beta-glucosidase
LKKSNLLILAVMVFIAGCVENREKTGKENSAVENLEESVESLLKKMTIEEKIGQMNQYASRWEMTGPAPGGDENSVLQDIKSGMVGSMLNVVGARATREAQKLAVENSRLGIPMIFGYDVVHGFRTIFPIPLAEAASWDPEAVRKSSAVAAREAAASGLHWTFAPMVDICRDARWGRIMEGSGEDPYLVSALAAARVHGFQGDDLASAETIAACAKHFAAYGFAESGRDYNCVDISETTLREVVLPPFRAAVEAGVATFMNAFNTIGGVPATAHHHLLRDILKGEWNFNGFIVSDWGSILELVNHGIASDKQEAGIMALRAGTDMDLEGTCYIGLAEKVKNGELDEKLIDDAVRRILRIKFRLGLLDDPYKYSDSVREINTLLSHENLAMSREMARKSIVLLKNDRNLLPLKKAGHKILVIGELAGSKDVPLGSWRASAIPNSAVSLLEGILQTVTDPESVTFVKGPDYVLGQRTFTNELNFNLTDRKGIPEAAVAASRADVVIIALGEDCFQSGEGRSQAEIGFKGLQEELLEAVYKVNKNVVVVLMNGRPLDITCMAETVPAILETWHLGSQAGAAIADVLFGDYNPSGKLPVTFPRSVGQLPVYYNHLITGRPVKTDIVFWSHYTDELNEPLFPFGFGLSYTTFEYSDLRLSSNKMKLNGNIRVTVKIKNTGSLAGEEVVQLYVRDLVGSVSRPVKELKGFRKVMVSPGETAVVEFSLEPESLAYFHPDGKWVTEPGQFILWVGPDSARGLEAGFEIE